MNLTVAGMVLFSALLHPLWNALIKREERQDGAFIGLVSVMIGLSAVHSLIAGYDLLSGASVWPLLCISVLGQLLYGYSLISTLQRGDLSLYYPIIRSSPLFIVAVGLLFLDYSYSWSLLIGIACVLVGAFALLYRRGVRYLDDPKALMFSLFALSGTGVYSIVDSRAMQVIEPPVLFFWVELSILPVYVVLFRLVGPSGTVVPDLFQWLRKPFFFLGLGSICYLSYFLILTAYAMGGDVAAVTSVRQASIPVSVLIGGLLLREKSMVRRLLASLLVASGIVVIIISG